MLLPEPSSPATTSPGPIAGSVSNPDSGVSDVVRASDESLNMDQQLDELLDQLDTTQRKVALAMEEPARAVETDIAALELAFDEARANLSEQEQSEQSDALPGADSTLPEMVSQDVAPTDALDASLAEQELLDEEPDGQQDEAGLEGESESTSDVQRDVLDDVASDMLDDSPVESLDNLDDLLNDVLDEELIEEVVNEDPLAEAKESFVNQWLAPESATPEAIAAQDAAIEEAIKAPAASRATPVDPAQAEELLADLDRAIAETASEMIAAETPAAPVVKPVSESGAGSSDTKNAAPDPSTKSSAATASAVTHAAPNAKAAGNWIWSRLEPKLLQGVSMLSKPIAKKPASTRHALGLVGVYTLVIAAACWGWVVFLRPTSVASGAVEPFDFQKSGLPGPELHDAHGAHGGHAADDAHAKAEPADKGGGGGHGTGDAKDGKDKKKPVLNSTAKPIVNKTIDDRTKKAKDAKDGKKTEKKGGSGH